MRESVVQRMVNFWENAKQDEGLAKEMIPGSMGRSHIASPFQPTDEMLGRIGSTKLESQDKP
jgi:hypothetical protein